MSRVVAKWSPSSLPNFVALLIINELVDESLGEQDAIAPWAQAFSLFIQAGGVLKKKADTGEKSLKLYTLYATPEHAAGTAQETKADALASKEHFDEKTTE